MADSIVEPSGSASISSLMQNQQQAVNLNIIPIHMDIDTASSQSHPRPPPINQSAINPSNSNDITINPIDEPETKHRKTEPLAQPSTSLTNEKLESRLGGILCCAVCLDLPKTAMYQVRGTRISRKCVSHTSLSRSCYSLIFPLSHWILCPFHSLSLWPFCFFVSLGTYM